MSKNEKNLITINDKEHNIDDFTDEQKIMLNHINDLSRKLDNARFNLDQLACCTISYFTRRATRITRS